MQLSLFTFSFHDLARARKMRPTGEFEPTDVGCYGTRYGINKKAPDGSGAWMKTN